MVEKKGGDQKSTLLRDVPCQSSRNRVAQWQNASGLNGAIGVGFVVGGLVGKL